MNKLDHRVAEYVMGWKWYTACGYSYLVPPSIHEYFDNFSIHWTPGKHGKVDSIEQRYTDYTHLAMLPYSTKIEYAWKVLEYLRATRDYCCLSVNHPYGEPIECMITKIGDNKHPQFVGKSDKSAAEAICLAALKVK